MDPQAMLFGAGGALLAVLAFGVFRSLRSEADLGPVSHDWLTDRQRGRSDGHS
jgi:hypothetical protein